MKRSEVYSWRMTPETRAALDFAARREGGTVAALLDRITQEWLQGRRQAAAEDEEQARLRRAVAATLGTISGGDSRRSERVRAVVRQRLSRRHGR